MNLKMAHILSQDRNVSEGWTTSIHCSYYAVFQYMKYILAEKSAEQISYDEQNSHSGEDSHKYILNRIKNRINNVNDARDISDSVKNLKQLRKLADYQTKTVTQEESLDCKAKAEAIITKLANLFKS